MYLQWCPFFHTEIKLFDEKCFIGQPNTASLTLCSIVECTDCMDDPILRFLNEKFPK